MSISQGRRRFAAGLLGVTGVCLLGAGGWLWTTRRAVSDAVTGKAKEQKLPLHGFEIVKSYPHDTTAYTQGLLFHDGHLYESTGQYGQSTVRKVEIATGKVLQKIDLNRAYFGEGLAQVGDELFQLTWKERTVFVYDRDSFKAKRTHPFDGQGWGLTYDGERLILSDGTSTLRFIDPTTFRVQDRVTVKIDKERLEELNELEYVEGEVWANVWFQDGIARIDPKSGKVVGWIDMSTLWPRGTPRPDDTPLNGIAYDPATKRVWVTGKKWPKLYEVKIVAK
jgi:glutamine cyclotransferase